MPIHVIDDENFITEMLCVVLSEYSNEVVPFESAEAYLEYMNSADYCAARLVITDIVMGNIDGFQLAKLIREKDAKVKIIAMSGFCNNNISDNAEIDHMLSKPFSIQELRSIVSNLLVSS